MASPAYQHLRQLLGQRDALSLLRLCCTPKLTRCCQCQGTGNACGFCSTTGYQVRAAVDWYQLERVWRRALRMPEATRQKWIHTWLSRQIALGQMTAGYRR